MLIRIETIFASLDATSPRYRADPRMWFRFVSLVKSGKKSKYSGGYSMIDAPSDAPRSTHTTTKKMRVWEILAGHVVKVPNVRPGERR